ncbi:MAG: hypothetical protein Q4B65_02305, partial [Candidatus Saccharibacteria bacterium]|nr:hypothetical protein [Candidatus Saccharibacteria bacterium]
ATANIKQNLSNGVTTIRETKNNFIVNTGDVGKSYYTFIETDGIPVSASTTSDSHSWYACCGSGCGLYGTSCCTRRRSHSFTTGTVYNDADGVVKSQSKVEIPYNFVNTASFNIDKSATDPVYSGETIKVSNATVQVGARYNSVTEANYATKVDNAKLKMIAYVTDDPSQGTEQRDAVMGRDYSSESRDREACSLVNDSRKKQCAEVNKINSTTLNADGSLAGGDDGIDEDFEDGNFNVPYDVFDASAGDYICFVMAVFPSTSGSNTNISSSGDNEWYVSAPRCAVIAKKPSFQIIGGSLYSKGSIVTNVSEKMNIYTGNINDYSEDGGFTTNFGSWVDQSTTVNGAAVLLASGASITNGTTSSYCSGRVPLSLANYVPGQLCPYGSIEATGYADIGSSTENRDALVNYWLGETTDVAEVGAGTIDLNNSAFYESIASATGADIRYTKSDNELIIQGTTINKKITHVVRTNNDVIIAGDLKYYDDPLDPLGLSSDISKLVIYANDITINCGVEQVDAILIAEGNVNTCPSTGGINAEERSKQLNIRGVVISESLDLNRTYGAASGSNSNVSAEVINYDTSAILWGRYMAGSAESDTLTVTYQHELAPRY